MSTNRDKPRELAEPDLNEDIIRSSEAEPGIASLALNEPSRRNVLSSRMVDALAGALSRIAEDRTVRVVIISGEGAGFCAGHDLGEIRAHRNDPDGGAAFNRRLFEQCGRLMILIRRLPQPVIACVEGVAVAAGCELVATCDMAVASGAARFGVNGIDIGFFCSTPGVALGRNLSRKAAMELLTTGRLIDAEEALALGLVNRVVEPGTAMAEAVRLARTIAEKPARAIALGKRTFNRQIERPVEEAYSLAAAAMVENLAFEEAREGIDAFIEKRPPQWRGQ